MQTFHICELTRVLLIMAKYHLQGGLLNLPSMHRRSPVHGVRSRTYCAPGLSELTCMFLTDIEQQPQTPEYFDGGRIRTFYIQRCHALLRLSTGFVIEVPAPDMDSIVIPGPLTCTVCKALSYQYTTMNRSRTGRDTGCLLSPHRFAHHQYGGHIFHLCSLPRSLFGPATL